MPGARGQRQGGSGSAGAPNRHDAARLAACGEGVDRLQLDATGLDVAVIKAQYRREFRAAVREAVAELSPRDRNLVRFIAIDGLSFQELAGLYRVNRTTLWRWFGRIRESLLRSTRSRLARALDLPASDVDSIGLTVNTTPVAGPDHGTLELSADGTFTYTHDGGETTSDSFTYTVSDGRGGTATGTVTVTPN